MFAIFVHCTYVLLFKASILAAKQDVIAIWVSSAREVNASTDNAKDILAAKAPKDAEGAIASLFASKKGLISNA